MSSRTADLLLTRGLRSSNKGDQGKRTPVKGFSERQMRLVREGRVQAGRALNKSQRSNKSSRRGRRQENVLYQQGYESPKLTVNGANPLLLETDEASMLKPVRHLPHTSRHLLQSRGGPEDLQPLHRVAPPPMWDYGVFAPVDLEAEREEALRVIEERRREVFEVRDLTKEPQRLRTNGDSNGNRSWNIPVPDALHQHWNRGGGMASYRVRTPAHDQGQARPVSQQSRSRPVSRSSTAISDVSRPGTSHRDWSQRHSTPEFYRAHSPGLSRNGSPTLAPLDIKAGNIPDEAEQEKESEEEHENNNGMEESSEVAKEKQESDEAKVVTGAMDTNDPGATMNIREWQSMSLSNSDQLLETMCVHPEEYAVHRAKFDHLKVDDSKWRRTKEDWDALYARRKYHPTRTNNEDIGWEGLSSIEHRTVWYGSTQSDVTKHAHEYAMARGGMHMFSKSNQPRGMAMHLSSEQALAHKRSSTKTKVPKLKIPKKLLA